MAEREALHRAVVLSTKKERDAIILNRYVENQYLIYSKEKVMKYVIQIENKKSENLQKNFYEHSSLM